MFSTATSALPPPPPSNVLTTKSGKYCYHAFGLLARRSRKFSKRFYWFLLPLETSQIHRIIVPFQWQYPKKKIDSINVPFFASKEGFEFPGGVRAHSAPWPNTGQKPQSENFSLCSVKGGHGYVLLVGAMVKSNHRWKQGSEWD